MSILENYEDVMSKYDSVCKERDNIKYLVDVSDKKLLNLGKELKDLTDEYENLDRVMHLFTLMSDNRTNDAIEVIQETINYALENVELEQNYLADIVATGTDLSFKLIDKETNEIRDVRHNIGTAVSQIVSVLTILVILKLSNSSKLLILDETLYGLNDVESIKMFAEVLSALAENEGFQILWVEHKSAIDTVDEVSMIKLGINQKDGTKIIEEKNYIPE